MSIPIGQSAAIERPDFNRSLHLTYTYEYIPGSPQSKIPNPPSGSPGAYNVRFVFCTPGKEEVFSAIDVVRIRDLGRSPLKLGVSSGLDLRVDLVDPLSGAPSATIKFGTNPASEISHADMTIQAQNFKDAYQAAYNLVMPLLSWWSYCHDVGIGVAGCHIEEEATKSIRLAIKVLGKQKTFAIAPGKIWPSTPTWRAVFSSYREALNANNVFFQFLCFYKAVEAVGKIRAARSQREQDAGGIPQTPPERVPDSYTGYPGDAEAFAPYLGKKFTVVCDGFRETARNAIAHLDPFRTEPSLVADQCADVEKCEIAITVMKYIARKLIENEIAADPEMNPPPIPPGPVPPSPAP